MIDSISRPGGKESLDDIRKERRSGFFGFRHNVVDMEKDSKHRPDDAGAVRNNGWHWAIRGTSSFL